MAGPMLKPRLMARRMSVTARVRVSGVAYPRMATNMAGRKASESTMSTNTPMPKGTKPFTNCSITKAKPEVSSAPIITS